MVDIEVTPQSKATLISVSGRIDSMTSAELGSGLSGAIEQGHVNIVLDLSQVEYMSSAGLRELVAALKKVKRLSGDMRLAQPTRRVREVLEMAGLDTIFLIFDTQIEAVDSY